MHVTRKNDSLSIRFQIIDVMDPPPYGNCARTKVYIADVTAFALIVYDTLTDTSWKIQNKLVCPSLTFKSWKQKPVCFILQFYPYPNYGTFTLAGESWDLMDGLFGMTLSKSPLKDLSSNALSGTSNRQSERSLYFHALASGHENVVPCSLINNASIWQDDANSYPRAFKTIGLRGIQTAGKRMSCQLENDFNQMFFCL